MNNFSSLLTAALFATGCTGLSTPHLFNRMNAGPNSSEKAKVVRALEEGQAQEIPDNHEVIEACNLKDSKRFKKAMLDYNVSPNATVLSDLLSRPLLFYTISNAQELVPTLLELGASVNRLSNLSSCIEIALAIARLKEDREETSEGCPRAYYTVRYLIEKGAYEVHQTFKLDTPLLEYAFDLLKQYASPVQYRWHAETFAILVQKGGYWAKAPHYILDNIKSYDEYIKLYTNDYDLDYAYLQEEGIKEIKWIGKNNLKNLLTYTNKKNQRLVDIALKCGNYQFYKQIKKLTDAILPGETTLGWYGKDILNNQLRKLGITPAYFPDSVKNIMQMYFSFWLPNDDSRNTLEKAGMTDYPLHRSTN